jgi:hypothetical protein
MLTTQKLMPRLRMRLCSEILAAHFRFRCAGTGAEVHSGLAQRGLQLKQSSGANNLSLYVRFAGHPHGERWGDCLQAVGLTEYHNPCRMCCHAYALTRILEGHSLSVKAAGASSNQVGVQEPLLSSKDTNFLKSAARRSLEFCLSPTATQLLKSVLLKGASIAVHLRTRDPGGTWWRPALTIPAEASDEVIGRVTEELEKAPNAEVASIRLIILE